MYQWRRVTLLSLITMSLLLAGTMVQGGQATDIIPLGDDSSVSKASVALGVKSPNGLTLNFQAPFLELATQQHAGDDYQLINIPGTESDGLEGQPSLPMITRLVSLPDGQTLSVINIVSNEITVEGSFRPMPTQAIKSIDDSSFELDSAFYSNNKRSEAIPMVTVGQPALLRGERVVPVSFRPVVWNAVNGNLIVSNNIEVSFELVASNDGNKSKNANRLVPQSFASMYENEIIGYELNSEVMSGPGTYLIIYPASSTVRAAIDPLVAWRIRQGYNVVVASTSETGNNTTSIKNYIQTQYNTLTIPLEFVTLVGDANGSVSIPTYTESLSGYDGEGDHPYTMLEGGDLLADVHLGRLSVTSTSMLTDVVTKIVKYETDPYLESDSGWFARASLTGDPAQSGYSTIWISQWVKQQLLELSYTQVDTIWSGNFRNLMMASINEGKSLFTYRGYWGMSGLSSAFIGSLSNGEKLPFALIVTCDTGSFQSDETCQSEAFFRNANGGSVAAVGTATIGTHTRYNNCVFQGVTEALLNSGDSRVGPALTAGKLHMYQNYIERESDKVEIWSTWNNLMGDPATAVWSAIPRTMVVDYPSTITSSSNNLPVTVTNGGLPQADALVTIYRKNIVQISAVTDSYGRVNLPLSSLTNGSYLVTVTGRNVVPHLGGFNVGELAASVNYSSMNLDDDNTGSSNGNNDGAINPGETLEIALSVVNDGTGGVNNVSADLTSPNSLVIVEQGTSDFGYIDSGATAIGQQNFVVRVDAAVPGGTVVPLELIATDGNESWTSLVNLVVQGANAELQGYALSTGNIDPGETATMTVTLTNIGDLGTSGVTGTLSSNSRWLTVTDDSGSFGAISAGGNGSSNVNSFSINAGVECYPGHTATLTLDLNFDEGGTASFPILVTVGNAGNGDPVGPDNYGYYAFDNTDTAYDNAPAYNWVEIAPSAGGQGTSLGLQDFARWEDDVVIVDLPFPFTYYGQTFTKMSVCSNGWVSMGGTDVRSYRNWTLPSPGTPDNMIAVYWDDLHVQSSNSGIYSWYDDANHRLIIQWDNVANSVNYNVSETFEVILEDPAYNAGDTGDGIITMHYQDVNHTDSETGYGTVGIQNEDRNDAVLYTYFELYPGGAASLVDGRSITFRTVVPQAQGTLSGIVTNEADGAPVDGASVSILGTGLSLFSTVDGAYQSGVTIGTYDVAVHHPSFAPDTTFGVVIQEDMETVVDFSLMDIAGPAFEMLVMPESSDDTVGPYDVVYKVSDYSGIQDAHFYYTSSATGGPFELMPQAEGPVDTWRVSIPGQPDGTMIQYWLTASDLLAYTSTEPSTAPYSPHSFVVATVAVSYASTMENASDWTSGLSGDSASAGVWENVDPIGVFNGSTEISPEDDNSDVGTMCWITGQDPVDGSQGANDVDGGVTTLVSPLFNISNTSGLEVQYHRWYSNDTGNSPNEDDWVVQALDQSGSWINLESTTTSTRSWQKMTFILADYMDLGNNLQFRFLASDFGAGSVVEAGVDDFQLSNFTQVSDGAAPVVSLLSPNGGENLNIGSVTAITWDQSDDIGVVNVEILLSTNNGSSYDTVIAEGAFNGTYNWTVPSLAGSDNMVKIIAHDSAGNSTETVSADNFIIGGISAVGDLPSGQLLLAQNAPNPFNPRTEIKFALPVNQDVTLRVYNIDGRLVRTLLQGRQIAGTHTVAWSGHNDQGGQVASGLYFYRLITDSGTLTRKMTLLK